MESGELDDAEALLVSLSGWGALDPSDLRGLLRDLAVSRINAGDLDKAEALVATGPLAATFDPAVRRELLAGIVLRRADRIARKPDYAAAAAAVADGISRLGAEPDLLEAYEMYTHNAAAELFNSRRFSEAKKLLEAALARYPGEPHDPPGSRRRRGGDEKRRGTQAPRPARFSGPGGTPAAI